MNTIPMKIKTDIDTSCNDDAYDPEFLNQDIFDSKSGISTRNYDEEVDAKSETNVKYQPTPFAEEEDDASDREYKIEDIRDPTTPKYAPSVPNDSDNSISDDELPAMPPARSVDVDESIDKSAAEHKIPDVLKIKEDPGVEDEIVEGENVTVADGDDNDFEGFGEEEQVEQPEVEGIMADIFGESDAEEEFEGFNENDVQNETIDDSASMASSRHRRKSGHDHLRIEEDNDEPKEFVSDFDAIVMKKLETNRRKRRRDRDVEFLNDSDELISNMIGRMRQAAEADRVLLESGKPAIKKLAMIKSVSDLLKKADLKASLVESGMLSAITDWLAPLTGHILPNLIIREALLKSLTEFNDLSPDVLKESGIGKAIMYLFKHPKETRANKLIAGRLINEWSRPIFNLQSDYKSLSKAERRQLNSEQIPKRRRSTQEVPNEDIDDDVSGLRPGEDGFVSRARVPQPSTKDYVVAPRWNLSEEEQQHMMMENDNEDEGDGAAALKRRLQRVSGATGKGKANMSAPTSRLESNIRNLTKNAGVKKRFVRAVNMSIEGRNMAL